MTSRPVPLPFTKLELVYEQLAEAIDRAGEANEALFLTKLVMVMAQHSGETLDFACCLEVAGKDLEAASAGRVS